MSEMYYLCCHLVLWKAKAGIFEFKKKEKKKKEKEKKKIKKKIRRKIKKLHLLQNSKSKQLSKNAS